MDESHTRKRSQEVPKPKRVMLVNRQRKLKVNSAAVRELSSDLLAAENIASELAVEIVFLRDEPMALLNESYRQRPGSTDVLSFIADSTGWPDDEPGLLGTVIVSVDRAADQAAERGLSVDEEIKRLIVHGLLHLCGYTHRDKSDRARMTRRERTYLKPRTGGR